MCARLLTRRRMSSHKTGAGNEQRNTGEDAFTQLARRNSFARSPKLEMGSIQDMAGHGPNLASTNNPILDAYSIGTAGISQAFPLRYIPGQVV